MNIFKIPLALVLLALFLNQSVFAQTVIDSLSTSGSEEQNTPLVEETVKTISQSKRIFIITNNNNSFTNGDYLSIILNDQLVARSIAAKNQDGLAGIKIIKIYSLKLWSTLHPGINVKILKGDDSFFLRKKVEEEKKGGDDLIKSEEDLYNEKLDEEVEEEENKSRAIKTDNILGVFAGQYSALDADGKKKNYPHFGIQWAYQFHDNFWGEFLYGKSTLTAYPSHDIDTDLTNYTFKFKYAFNAPFNTFLKPYVGYQIIQAVSPEAGASLEGDAAQQKAKNEEETQRVEELNRRTFIVGITALKRLVPGWFLTGNLGTDMMYLGFSLEF